MHVNQVLYHINYQLQFFPKHIKMLDLLKLKNLMNHFLFLKFIFAMYFFY